MLPLVARVLTILLAGMMLMDLLTTVLGMGKEATVLIMATPMPIKVSQLIKLVVCVVAEQLDLLQHHPPQLQARVLRLFRSQVTVYNRDVRLLSSTRENSMFVSI